MTVKENNKRELFGNFKILLISDRFDFQRSMLSEKMGKTEKKSWEKWDERGHLQIVSSNFQTSIASN